MLEGSMRINHKGEGKGGAIFGFAVFLLVLYLAWTIIPVMIRVYAFEDAVKEECKFLGGRTLDQLKEDIATHAADNDIPVDVEDISASKTKIEMHENLRVNIAYTVPITTPFYVYKWEQNINYDAPTFD
jgi:hypothetical protein